MTEQHAAAATELRARVAQLVSEVDPAALDAPAPACPGWRARDVLAHMVGVGDDVVSGRIDGIASDSWTAAQVERRRDIPIAELLADWEQWGPQFEQLLVVGPPAMTGQALYDAATHEHDLRHAIGRPGARDSTAMHAGWDWLVEARTHGGAPAIRFVTERGDDVAGVGDPCATVRAPYFELFRATTGRRTAAEISSFAWEPGPNIEMIVAAPFFTIRTESLGE
jgi:uncharacterized protein (TIGR03083 family)